MLKIDIRHDALDCLAEAVSKAIEVFGQSLQFSENLDDDRLVIAALQELWVMLEKKRDQQKYKTKMKYKITLTPVMGFALRVAFGYGLTTLDFTGNLLLDICNKVDKEYSQPILQWQQ